MRKAATFIFLCLSVSAFPQFYPREVGMRGGYSSGITFRVNIEEDLSYEAQLTYRQRGTIFSMLRQNHLEIGMDKNGNWEFLYGMGAHAGFYFTDSYRILWKEIYYGQNLFTPVIGVDGYIGVDYSLATIPVSFGCSFQPFMEISLRQIFSLNLWDFGIHVRYKF
jgi:hypothetical protein